MKEGRCPTKIGQMNTWSAEEWQKFIFPIADLIAIDLLPPHEYHLLWLTARITELLFHFRDGLTEELIHVLSALCKRRVEEWVGGKSMCHYVT